MIIKLTESQFKLLNEVKKKAYSFDWDDNILIMPTKIYLEYNINGLVWIPVSVSTEEFRDIRHKLGTEFRYVNNDILQSFKDFREYDSFLKDVQKSIKNRNFGPSFNKFKEALINGSDFSIITARSNPPQAIKEGIKILIDKTFTYDEKEMMENNLKGLSLDEYLNLQDYHPVSSQEFINKFELDIDSTNPEEGKKVAFKNFVERVVEQITSVVNNSDFEGISIGFSDDDEGNVKIIEKLIEEELKKLYPKINFIIYDTSDPKNPQKKRIFIKK